MTKLYVYELTWSEIIVNHYSFQKVPEGTNAKIGDLIALTVEPGEDWKSVEMPSGASGSAPAPSAPSSSAPPPPAAAAAPAAVAAEPPPGQSV